MDYFRFSPGPLYRVNGIPHGRKAFTQDDDDLRAAIGIGATFLAEPILVDSCLARLRFRLRRRSACGWSAALTVLRGTFRQGLLAAGHQALDLGCSTFSVALNVALNFYLFRCTGLWARPVAT